MTYDPVSGLYTQTFPPEHQAFLEKYGQHIDIPEPPLAQELQQYGWVYEEGNAFSTQAQQPMGFHYYPANALGTIDSEISMALCPVDHEVAYMLQYIMSLPVTVAQSYKQATPATTPWAGNFNNHKAVPNVSVLPFFFHE